MPLRCLSARPRYGFAVAEVSSCSSLELTGARLNDQGCLAILDEISNGGAELSKIHLGNNGITVSACDLLAMPTTDSHAAPCCWPDPAHASARLDSARLVL